MLWSLLCISVVKGRVVGFALIMMRPNAHADPTSSSLEMAAIFKMVARNILARIELTTNYILFEVVFLQSSSAVSSPIALEVRRLSCNKHYPRSQAEYSPDELGMSAMNEALQTNNKLFVSNMKYAGRCFSKQMGEWMCFVHRRSVCQVTRILNVMQTPQYMCMSGFTVSGEHSALLMVRESAGDIGPLRGLTAFALAQVRYECCWSLPSSLVCLKYWVVSKPGDWVHVTCVSYFSLLGWVFQRVDIKKTFHSIIE